MRSAIHCLVITGVCACALGAHALGAPYHGAQYGYNLDIPEGWVQVSKEVLDVTMSMVVAEDAPQKPLFDAAFQRESASSIALEYPYLLVQILPYAQYGLKGQVHESDFDKVVEQLTGLNVEEAMERNTTPLAKEVMGSPQIKSVKLERERRRYVWDLTMELTPFGKVQGRCVGYFGRESIVQLAFYAAQEEWSQHEPTAAAMIDSFKFDPDRDYDETLPRESGWSRIMQGSYRGAIIGGVVGGLVGVLAVAFKRRKA